MVHIVLTAREAGLLCILERPVIFL